MRERPLASLGLYRDVVGEGADPLRDMTVQTFAGRLRHAIESTAPTVSDINDLGVGLLRERRYAAAREYFAIAASDVRAVGARVNLGRCELLLGRLENAEATARLLVGGSPGLAPAWQLLGESLAAQERHVDSVVVFRRAVACAPGHAALHRQLGDACQRADDAESARDAYRHALKLDGDDLGALQSLLFVKRRIYDWHVLDALSERLKKAVESGRRGVSPFDFLAEGAGAAMERVSQVLCSGDIETDHQLSLSARRYFDPVEAI